MNSLGSYTCTSIFPVHIITNNLQMANKLLHVLFPYKVSKMTQNRKNTALILKPQSGPFDAVNVADNQLSQVSILILSCGGHCPPFYTHYDQVWRLCKEINTMKSSGFKDIAANFFKDSFLVLVPQLVYMFNLSLRGSFPIHGKRLLLFCSTKEVSRLMSRTIDQYHCCHYQANCWRRLYTPA